MAEPLALATWLGQEEGFCWIPQALTSGEGEMRERAQRALAALEASLRRILAQGADRGWVRHRGIRYCLLVREEGGALQVMTLVRWASWLEAPATDSPVAGPAAPAAQPLPAVRRGPGDYYH